MCGCDACGCAYRLNFAGKFPFPDILQPEQKVALCAANKIGHLLLRLYEGRGHKSG